MNKLKIAAIAVLMCGLLCVFGAFGFSLDSTPYLSAREKDTLERQLFNSMIIESDSHSNCLLSFFNRSEYDIWDFSINRVDGAHSRLYLPSVPANTAVEQESYLNVYSDLSNAQGDKSEYYLKYTIGDYTYVSEPGLIRVQISDDIIDSNLSIAIETVNGKVSLDETPEIKFVTGKEISGLSSAYIYSISISYPYDGGLSITVNEANPSDKYVYIVYKLIDKDGLTIDNGLLLLRPNNPANHLSASTDTLDEAAAEYIHFYGLEPGAYTLRFKEATLN